MTHLALLERQAAGYREYLAALGPAEAAIAAGDVERVESAVNAAGRLLGELRDRQAEVARIRTAQRPVPGDERSARISAALDSLDGLARAAAAAAADLGARLRRAQAQLAAELGSAGGGAGTGRVLDRTA